MDLEDIFYAIIPESLLEGLGTHLKRCLALTTHPVPSS
jgi:hypothetical protein